MANDKALINGDAHDWVGVDINVLGRIVEGVSAVNYDLERAKANHRGRGSKAVSRGRGGKDYAGSITLSEAELNGIEKKLPRGTDITDIKPFNIIISMKRGTVFTVHKLIGCEFMNRGVDINTETTNIEKQINLIMGDIDFNG
jgi:hypothetical protein